MKDTCIICVGTGNYRIGIDRLEKSLNEVGYEGYTMLNKELPVKSPTHKENPYAFKTYAFGEAIERNFKKILWVDAALYARKSIDLILNKMENTGYYLVSNGFNLREECNDRCLKYFGFGHEEALQLPMLSTSLVGLNFDNHIAEIFFSTWHKSMEDGIFRGSRQHNSTESADPNFKYHRQDQSAASCIAQILEMQIDPIGVHLAYQDQGIPETAIFVSKGGF